MFDFMEQIFLRADGGDGTNAAGMEGSAGVMGQDAAGQDGRAAADAAGGADAQSQTVPDAKARKAAFERLIREEYAEEFKEKSQRMIQNRLRGSRAAEERLTALEPALQLMQRRYGTDDPAALVQAMTDDDRWYELEAQKRGMDVETYKLMDQQEMMIERMRQQQEMQNQQREKAEQVMKWRSQEAQLREIYPDFSLDEEMENEPEFFNLLKNGISVRHAYETIHMDDIMGQTVLGAVKRTAQRTMDTIRANGMRPTENGAGKAPGKPGRMAVKDFTPQQMRDIERRVKRGEVITADKLG